MKLRTRLDLFSAALFSALGVSPLVACGGSAIEAGAGGTGATSSTSGGGPAGGMSNGGQGGAAQSAAGGNSEPCTGPVDLGDGFFSCGPGFKHRAEVDTCASKLPRTEPYPNAPADAQCQSDGDCTAKPHGWCGPGGQVPGPLCYYGCVQDSECGAGMICECGDPVGRCVTASCSSDADCAAGFLCRDYDVSMGCDITQYACQSAADECATGGQCGEIAHGGACWYDPAVMHFACAQGGCVVGRPFLVEGLERTAPAVRRSDWCGLTRGISGSELAGPLRARLSREWTRIALMEHASIAAFARFSLQLLSLGAPAELIEHATTAMVDETKHAKACFALASAYAGKPVGPGVLRVERSLDEGLLAQIVRNTMLEGCVGETVAAIEAREAAEYAQDPQVCALLTMISEDEMRHAELAWRFVQWALATGDAAARAAVECELDVLARETENYPHSLGVMERELLENGVVPPPLRAAIRAGAWADVILPCARALLDAEGHDGVRRVA